MTILYIDGVDAAKALGAAHKEIVAEFKPDVALSIDDIRDITLVAQTRDNATTIGSHTPEQLAYHFARMILPSNRSTVQHIYLLASEAGMRKHGEMSLAQQFMQAMAAQGFKHLQVHAIVSPGVPQYGMGLEVVTDSKYSSSRAKVGYVNGFYYRDQHSHELDLGIFRARDAMESSQKRINAFEAGSNLSKQQRTEKRAEETRMRERKDLYHVLLLARKNDQHYQSNKITIVSTGNYKEAMQQPCNTFMAQTAEPIMSAAVSYAIHYLSSQKPLQKSHLDYIHNDLLSLRAHLNWGITDIVNELQKYQKGNLLYYKIIILPLKEALEKQDFSIIQPGEAAAAALQAHGFFAAAPGAYELTLRDKLEEYKALRESEWWGFHYNFLGVISVMYFISDCLLGTDYFNSKHRDIKVSAVNKLLNGDALEEFTEYEMHALRDGRLGKIVADNDGLDAVIAALRPAEGSSASSAAAAAFDPFTM